MPEAAEVISGASVEQKREIVQIVVRRRMSNGAHVPRGV